MEKPRFVYVTYIATTPETLWNALLDSKFTRQYWQHDNVSDWKTGSKWEHRRADAEGTVDLVGQVVECVPPKRLVLTWAAPADAGRADRRSRVTLEIEPFRGLVKLTVTHDQLEAGSDMLAKISRGWPMVLSSLKSLLEGGKALPPLW